MTKEIKIPEELAAKVQRAHIETEGLSNLITYMNNSGASQDTIEEYYDRYLKAYEAFSQAKTEVTKVLNAPNNATWNLDYSTGIVTVTYEK